MLHKELVNVLVKRLNTVYKNAVKTGMISSSIRDRDAFLGSFLQTTGNCVIFHSAQRDESISLKKNAYGHEKKRKNMSTAFLYFLEAVEDITGISNFKTDQVKAFNDGYKQNIKNWTNSLEKNKYMQWENKCKQSVKEYEMIKKEAKKNLDANKVQAEAVKRLTNKK